MLSAVSQQIQTIQLGLRSLTDQNEVVIELVGKSVRLNADTGKNKDPDEPKTGALLNLHRHFYNHEPRVCWKVASSR